MAPLKIKRALISVADKAGISEFARQLCDLDVEIISTGGTASLLRENGIPVTQVSELTRFPEILDGRVKTLHPHIHAGLLALRDRKSHQDELSSLGVKPIDLVVVNLYPFARYVAGRDAQPYEALEQIDIGGPAMLRAAAKNFTYVAAVVSPEDYGRVIAEMRTNAGALTLATRLYLARKAFAHTAAYDAAIANYLYQLSCDDESVQMLSEASNPPQIRIIRAIKVRDLRYGENPHQRAALYRASGSDLEGIAGAEVLHGKELSYNNLLDLDAAYLLVSEFSEPAAAIIKHTNPCGVAIGPSLVEAYLKALETDPVSAFGSVLGFNREVDEALALQIAKNFVEAIVAPGYTQEAIARLTAKRNLRLVRCPPPDTELLAQELEIRSITGGLLIQERDLVGSGYKSPPTLRVVTKRQPSRSEIKAMLFAWSVVKHVKSNAIVYAAEDRTLGIGAGQMSRVDSVKVGAMKARDSLQGSALASDAFFPFRDGIDEAARVGVTAIIQPGGSIRDEEVIRAADEHDMAMVFTGVRHFKH